MILKIGHRGACGYEPENTLRSFEKALQLGVDMIELDVRICKSGDLVVIHDDKLERTTNGEGRVSEKWLYDLRKLDAGKGEKIPLLEEVLDLISGKAKVNIELKEENIANYVFEIIEKYIKGDKWSQDDFLISSFHLPALQEFDNLNPDIKTGLLTFFLPKNLKKIVRKVNIHSVNPSATLINKNFIGDMKKKNTKVFVWTVNNPEDIQKMKLAGVDGIISDYPDRI
jgi:glycerophosphoryl diester phosphodiesterase